MAKLLRGVWDRAQGKVDVLSICDRVFEELAGSKTELLAISLLHTATLMVYNSINKQLMGPHKEPPSMEVVKNKIKVYQQHQKEGIPLNEFRDLILEWVRQDLRLVLLNKAALAILAAPLLAVTAKGAGRKVPRVKDAAEKVPTPLLVAVFSVGLMLLQDVRAGSKQ